MQKILNKKTSDAREPRTQDRAIRRRAMNRAVCFETMEDRTLMSVAMNVAAPTGLTASALSATSVALHWADADKTVTGRAGSDGAFSAIAKVSGGGSTNFTDNSAAAHSSYRYEVQAVAGVFSSAASGIVAVSTPYAQPQSPSKLNATVGTNGVVTLAWTDNDVTALSYAVLRSINGGKQFVTIATVNGTAANTYLDSSTTGGGTYQYCISALNPAGVSPPSNAVSVTVPAPVPVPAAPINFSAQMMADTTTNSSYAMLYWMNSDKTVTGYIVSRSTNGGPMTQLARVTTNLGSFMQYADKSSTPDTVYQYQVQAFNSAGGVSSAAKASLTTAPARPTNLIGAIANGKVNLTWKAASDSNATGYQVLKSTDGNVFSKYATISGAANQSYTDGTQTAGSVAYYEVLMTGAGGSSMYSNIVEARMPLPSTFSVTTRFGNELVVNDPTAGDKIAITQTGSTLAITVNGTTSTQAVSSGGLFVYLRAGNETLTLDSSVTCRATVVAVNGSNSDSINVSPAGDNVWMDSGDTFSGSAMFHSIASFAGGVSKAIGASLANPLEASTFVGMNLSLFGTGIAAADANKGQVGDCWLISAMASLANTTPGAITNSMVDLGDGTYAVQLYSNGQSQYYRVNNQFATPGACQTFPAFCSGGDSGHLWAAVLEKAFAYFRTGANSYASLNGGNCIEVFNALNQKNDNFSNSNYTDAPLAKALMAKLAAGKAVALGTMTNAANLVKDHGYSLMSVTFVNGVGQYTVRNPWGFAGDGLENRNGIATLTFAQFCANFVGGTWLL